MPRALSRRWAVAAILAAGLAARLLPWAAVFHGGRVFFIDTDDYYHWRRMMTAASQFPFLSSLDYYLGFPEGWHCSWPPLYDLLGALLILVTGLGRPTSWSSQATAALIAPAAGTLTLWAFHRAARKCLSPGAALCALAFAAILPLPVFYTLLGRPDHHCLENLWFFLALPPCLALLEEKPRRPFCSALLAAAVLGTGVLTWVGSILFSSILFLFFTIELSYRSVRGQGIPRACFWFGPIFLMEALIVFLGSFLNYWYVQGLYAFDAPSPFQPLFLTLLGLATFSLYYGLTERKTAKSLAALAAAAAVALWLIPRALPSISRFASRPSALFATFSEMQPFFYGDWPLSSARHYFGYSLLALPFLAVAFARKERGASARLVLIWTVVLAILGFWQTRYAYHFSFCAAFFLGYGLDLLLKGAGRSLRWAVLAGALLLLGPALKNLAALPFAGENLVGSRDLIEACEWMRDHTPATKSLWRDQGSPEYGVYAIHDLGNQIAALAERPAAAGNMHLMPEAIRESVLFFFIESSERAYELLTGRSFRYILLSDMLHDGVLPLHARLFGESRYFAAPRGDGALYLSPAMLDLVYTRLYLFDGAPAIYGGKAVAPVSHFRLVHESPRERDGVHLYKVFEAVRGAVLTGTGRPGELVEADCPVVTDQGRRFVYRVGAICDRQGRFKLSLPYAGEWVVRRAKRARKVLISEEAVIKGQSLPWSG